MALLEMALCSSLPTQLAIGWGLRLAGWSPVDGQGNLQLGFVTVLTLLDTVALVWLMVTLLRASGQHPSALWLGTRPVAGEVVKGILHMPVVFAIAATLLLTIRALTPDLHNVDVNPFEALAGDTASQAVMLLLVAIVGGGVREELQRAFLLDRFERYLGPACGMGGCGAPERRVRARAPDAGTGRRNRDGGDGRVLGGGLSTPAQQRGSHGEPRAVQLPRSAAHHVASR
jgi:hypothetical protein